MNHNILLVLLSSLVTSSVWCIAHVYLFREQIKSNNLSLDIAQMLCRKSLEENK